MEDDSAAGQADLLFLGDGMPSSGEDPSDDDPDVTAANSEEDDSEDEGLDEEEDEPLTHDVRKALKRPREESSGDEDEEGPDNDLLDIPPRKRGLDDLMREFGDEDGLDDDEDDDSDEDDEEWTPWGKPSWVCVNCTCSTGDEYTFCSVSVVLDPLPGHSKHLTCRATGSLGLGCFFGNIGTHIRL